MQRQWQAVRDFIYQGSDVVSSLYLEDFQSCMEATWGACWGCSFKEARGGIESRHRFQEQAQQVFVPN